MCTCAQLGPCAVAHDPSGIAQGVTPVGRPSVPSHPLPSSQLAKHEDDEEFVLTVTEETEGAPALSFPPLLRIRDPTKP